jgi:hypothetical protein
MDWSWRSLTYPAPAIWIEPPVVRVVEGVVESHRFLQIPQIVHLFGKHQ